MAFSFLYMTFFSALHLEYPRRQVARSDRAGPPLFQRQVGDLRPWHSRWPLLTLDAWAPDLVSPTALRRRRWLATSEVVVAVAAIAGSVGLVVSSIDLGTTIHGRLPFKSPAFAALHSLWSSGLPMASAAVAAWRGSRRRNPLAIVAGALLMGRIVVEIGVMQSCSWLQPTFLTWGAGHRPVRLPRLAPDVGGHR